MVLVALAGLKFQLVFELSLQNWVTLQFSMPERVTHDLFGEASFGGVGGLCTATILRFG